jgi:hypothetical protein
MSSTIATTFEWNLERFPDSRLATNVVENLQALVAALFGVLEDDLPSTIPSVATYDAVFDQVQQCIVPIERALIIAASEAVQSVVERVDASQRLIELAKYDAQLTTLHLGAALLYHATCRADPQKDNLLRCWVPEKVWEFLDLSEALGTEATHLEWTRAEFSPSSSTPPIPQATTSKLMSVPLRSTAEIPSRRATNTYPKRDWFRKRSATLAAKVGQQLTKDKAGLTCLLKEGAGEVSGATRTSAVESQLSEEAGKSPRRPEPTPEADSSSDSEPEEVVVRDPLDPGPNFHHHPNALGLWAARAERWKAEGSRGPASAATAGGTDNKPPPGKLGHSWNGCCAKEPNASAGNTNKRRGDNDSRGSSSFKKPKISVAAAAVASEPGRIIEILEDEDEDLDVDIWA